MVDAWVRAARSGDRPTVEALSTDADPSFRERRRLLYDNLQGLPFADLTVRLEPARLPLTAPRQQQLGADAFVQRATVGWRLPGEQRDSLQHVWLTFRPQDGQLRLAGTVDRPTGTGHPAQPVWWLGPVRAGQQGSTVVLAGAGQEVDHWLGLSAAAQRDVDRELPATVRRRAGAVVVEVPSTTADFEAVLGVPPGSYAGIAAVTAPEGLDGRGPTRVVVNPAVATRLSADGIAVTLTHELVHVATGSANSPAPTWAVEGLADYVALRAHPGAQPAAASALLRRVRASGPPRALPTAAAFATGSGGLDRTYAEAWLACRFIAERTSPERLGRFYTDLDAGRSVSAAARSRLGLSPTALVEGWRAYLAQLARRS